MANNRALSVQSRAGHVEEEKKAVRMADIRPSVCIIP